MIRCKINTRACSQWYYQKYHPVGVYAISHARNQLYTDMLAVARANAFRLRRICMIRGISEVTEFECTEQAFVLLKLCFDNAIEQVT